MNTKLYRLQMIIIALELFINKASLINKKATERTSAYHEIYFVSHSFYSAEDF